MIRHGSMGNIRVGCRYFGSAASCDSQADLRHWAQALQLRMLNFCVDTDYFDEESWEEDPRVIV